MKTSLPAWNDLFHGYDLRATFPDPLSEDVATGIGRSLARALPGPFVVGRDVRRESVRVMRGVTSGLVSMGRPTETVGIAPTPAIAFWARLGKAYGIAITPSHNAPGHVGIKGFGPSGRLFDSEWEAVRSAFEREARAGPRGTRSTGRPGLARRVSHRPIAALRRDYIRHVTRDLASHRLFALDCRGGATAVIAPIAFRALGSTIVEVTQGYSADFFGRDPEPDPRNAAELARLARSSGATAGFAFDGDGDRCLVVDGGGRPASPEVVALLLHETRSTPDVPLVATFDASPVLDKWVRTVRCQVGSRYVLRTMRATGATVGMESSGHFYLRTGEGVDSDGIRTACLIADRLDADPDLLRAWSRRIGTLHRGSLRVDFPTHRAASRAYVAAVRLLGSEAQEAGDGYRKTFRWGWCLFRRSRTQPSIRFVFEAPSAVDLRRLSSAVKRWAQGVPAMAESEP